MTTVAEPTSVPAGNGPLPADSSIVLPAPDGCRLTRRDQDGRRTAGPRVILAVRLAGGRVDVLDGQAGVWRELGDGNGWRVESEADSEDLGLDPF